MPRYFGVTEGPVRGFTSITFGTPFNPVLRGIHTNASGTAVIVAPDGSTATLNMLAGNYYPYPISQVNSGGTIAAADLIGLR